MKTKGKKRVRSISNSTNIQIFANCGEKLNDARPYIKELTKFVYTLMNQPFYIPDVV
jgi:hypothetical protein